MSTVWVTNFAGHNYQQAEEFGEIKPITMGYVNVERFDRLLYEVTNRLKDSEPDDWLLPAGLLVINLLAAIVFFKMHGVIRLLLWDSGRYRKLIMDDSHFDYLIRSLAGNGGREQEEEVRHQSHQDTD